MLINISFGLCQQICRSNLHCFFIIGQLHQEVYIKYHPAVIQFRNGNVEESVLAQLGRLSMNTIKVVERDSQIMILAATGGNVFYVFNAVTGNIVF